MAALNKKTIEDIEVKGRRFLFVVISMFRLKTALSPTIREL